MCYPLTEKQQATDQPLTSAYTMKLAIIPLILILVFGTTNHPQQSRPTEVHQPIAPLSVETYKLLEPIKQPDIPLFTPVKHIETPKPAPKKEEPKPQPVATPVVTETPRQTGQRMAAEMYGWTGHQWVALEDLWTKESGWRPTAQNPSSTAYGIAQFLDSTWGLPGLRPYNCVKTSDPSEQIRCGLIYIKLVYHTPSGALGFWHSKCGTYQGCHY